MGTVIGIGLGLPFGRRINWAAYWAAQSFSPDSTGAENVAALNAALDKFSTVKIVTPGVYDFDNTIWIPSNTTLQICEGVTFRKETGSTHCHIIGNKGMLTDERDTNIILTGNGVILDVNGIDTYSSTDTDICPILRLRGILQFHKVDNFTVDGIVINDYDITAQYCTCFNECTFGDISNFNITAYKDACNILACTDMNVTDMVWKTTDDGTFIGVGYPNNSVSAANTERISYERITLNLPDSGNGGWISRLYTATWDDWQTGYTYSELDLCLNNGIIYGRGFNTGGDLVSSVAPTHTSGAVTGADGIEWWVMNGDAAYKSDVIDITFKDVTVNYDRQLFLCANLSIDGARERGKIDNLIIDNISIIDGHSKPLIQWATRIDELVIKNSIIPDGNAPSKGVLLAQDYGGAIGVLDVIAFNNCTVNLVNADFFYMNKDNAIINEIRLINTTLNLGARALAYVAATTAQIGKITTQGGQIVHTGAQLISTAPNRFNGNNTFNGTSFTVKILAKVAFAGGTGNFALTNCSFVTSLEYIIVVTVAGSPIVYSSVGTAYIDPVGYLFYTNQAIGDIDINLSTSSGTVTPAKVRNGTKVTVTACDLAYV